MYFRTDTQNQYGMNTCFLRISIEILDKVGFKLIEKIDFSCDTQIYWSIEKIDFSQIIVNFYLPIEEQKFGKCLLVH